MEELAQVWTCGCPHVVTHGDRVRIGTTATTVGAPAAIRWQHGGCLRPSHLVAGQQVLEFSWQLSQAGPSIAVGHGIGLGVRYM